MIHPWGGIVKRVAEKRCKPARKAERSRDMESMKTQQMVGEGVRFERIRRITGYLVGTLDRFNNAKREEEHDRVKHYRMGKWN